MNASQAAFRRGRTCSGLAAALAVALWSAPLWAVDSAERSAARQLAQQGVEAYQAEDYEKALDRLERAYKTLPAPTLALWSARSLEKLGRWVEASERYLEATRIPIDQKGDARVQEEARKEAELARERLTPRIPILTIEVEGAGEDVEVRVGDRVLGAALIGADLPTDPGTIHVTATSAGRTVERDVQLNEAERKVVSLTFDGARPGSKSSGAPAPAAATASSPEADRAASGSWQRPAGWIAIGLGAASIGLGAGFGLDAIAKRDASASDCDENDVCGSSGTELRNAGLTSAAISTATFIAGGVLAVGGVTLLLTAPRKEKSAARLEFMPTIGGAALFCRGEF